jgi:MFS family permease
VLASLLGLVNAFDNPTRQAFVVEMVGREDLVNAVALNSMLFNSARILGPAVGGILIASIGLAECFYANAASFLAVLAGLLLMREDLLHTPHRRPAGRVASELAEGLRYAVHTPAVFLIVILMGALGTFGYNFNTTLPLLARTVLGVDAAGYGALMSVMGAGSLIAASAFTVLQRATPRRLFLGAASFTLVIGALAVSRWYPVSVVLMLPLGFASITFTTSANTRLQLEVPDSLRGRVMSLYTLLFAGTTPIGGLLTGLMAEHWGIQWTLGIEAAICSVGVIAGLTYYLQCARRTAPELEDTRRLSPGGTAG